VTNVVDATIDGVVIVMHVDDLPLVA